MKLRVWVWVHLAQNGGGDFGRIRRSFNRKRIALQKPRGEEHLLTSQHRRVRIDTESVRHLVKKWRVTYCNITRKLTVNILRRFIQNLPWRIFRCCSDIRCVPFVGGGVLRVARRPLFPAKKSPPMRFVWFREAANQASNPTRPINRVRKFNQN